MYIVNQYENRLDMCETASEAADLILDNIEDDVYDDYIDETEPEIEIFGMHYSPSLVLQRVDPVAYRCCQIDIQNILREDIKYDLDMLEDGEVFDTYSGISVELVKE